MAEYLSPGVYVEEIDAGPKPIEGVSTSTAGAVGVTAFGPTDGKPKLVTSFGEFVRTFGSFLDEPDVKTKRNWESKSEGGYWWQFPLSVKGFFDNGGQRLYVKRVFSQKSATASSLVFGQGVVSELTANAKADDTTIRVRHILGIPLPTTVVRIFSSGKPLAGPYKILSYGADGTLTLDKRVGQDLVAGQDWVEIVARSAVPAPPLGSPPNTLIVRANAMGDWGGNDDPNSPNSILHGNGLSVRIRPVVGVTLSIQSDPVNGGPAISETTSADVAKGLMVLPLGATSAFVANDVVTINDQTFSVTSITAPQFSVITLNKALGAAVTKGTVITRAAAVGGKPELKETVTVDALATDTTLSVGTKTDLADTEPFTVAGIAGPGFVVTGAPAQGHVASITLNDSPAKSGILAAGATIRRLRTANATGGNASPNLRARNASQLYRGALVELDNGTQKEVTTVSTVTGDTVTFAGNLTNLYHENDRIRVVEAELGVRYMRSGKVMAQETFSNLKLFDDGTLDYLVTNVNEGSSLVTLEAGDGFNPTTLAAFPSIPPATAPAPEAVWGNLTGGADHLEDLSVDDFVGNDGGSGHRTGIVALEDIDELSLCIVPGMWSTTIQSALITHCETLRYRFAILDPPDGLDNEGIRGFREPIDTKYAALYYPWLVARDPSAGRDVHVAPSAHMAGLYARVDVERGVHKAPANEVVRNISSFAQDVNKREQDLLNPKNINALRFFPGRGNRVWGARVVTSDSAWKYVNVRRLFIYVEASIDQGTQWVVFEPNDETLWSRVRQSITNFLDSVWRGGALMGTKAADAFFVKCDRSTMTQDDLDNGRLICLIGIAPVKPAEFVIFQIQQKTLTTDEG